MNIHTYEKVWLVAAMVLIVGFIGTIAYGSTGVGIAMISDDEETIDPNALDEDERFADPRVEEAGENQYNVYVVAYQYGFDPGSEHITEPIVVPENSEVTFYVTSEDVIHSFSLVGTNVNTMVVPGEVSTMTAEFDEPAEYGILCNEYCGSGHHSMEGMLYVVPEDEFDIDDQDDESEADRDEADQNAEESAGEDE